MDGLKAILGSIHQSGQMDDLIVQSMRDRVGNITANRIFDELKQAGESANITLDIPNREFEKSTDKSPLGPPPKDDLFDQMPAKKVAAIEGGAGVALTAIGAWGVSEVNKTIAKKREEDKPITWRDRIKKGALCFAVVTGVALAIDAATGCNGMKSLAAMMNRNNSGNNGWRSRM